MTTTHKKRKLALAIGIMVGAAMLIPSGGAQPPEEEGPTVAAAIGAGPWTWFFDSEPIDDAGAVGVHDCDGDCDRTIFNGVFGELVCNEGDGVATLLPGTLDLVDLGRCGSGVVPTSSILPTCTVTAWFIGGHFSGYGGGPGACR